MHPRLDPSDQLLALAALQAGVVTSEQTLGHGLTKTAIARLTGEGRWRRVAKGLYLVSDQPPDWEALAWSGVLLGGESARLGGAAAGHLHGLNDPPDEIEVLLPWTTIRKARSPWLFVRERTSVRSPRSVGSPPRLSVEETVIDLSQRSTEGQVVHLVTKAVQNRRTTAARLERCASGRTRLRHRRLLKALLLDVADGAETPLEVHYARDVERAHDLPAGKRQKKSRRGRYYRDVTYEDFGLIVELDGRLGHEGEGHFRDMHRDNEAVLLGEVTLRYGWFDVVDRPCQAAFQVGTVLSALGWSGLPGRCPSCEHATDQDIV